MITFTSSSLVHLLHDGHPNLLPHLMEFQSPERLRQDVCQLIMCADVFNSNRAPLDTFSDEVKPGINVFASLMIHRVLAQRYS